MSHFSPSRTKNLSGNFAIAIIFIGGTIILQSGVCYALIHRPQQDEKSVFGVPTEEVHTESAERFNEFSLEDNPTDYSDLPPLVANIDEDAEMLEGSSSYNESSREKRKLPANEITKKVIMLLVDKDKRINETYAHIQNRNTSTFSTLDFIIRMQEKYEYSTCLTYLSSVPELENNYFLYDEDLVNIENDKDNSTFGDEEQREDRRLRANETFHKRYRLFGEECDPEEEWNFWRDMFIAAENDTIATPKKAISIVEGSKPYYNNYTEPCQKKGNYSYTVANVSMWVPFFCENVTFGCDMAWCNMTFCTNETGNFTCTVDKIERPPPPPSPTLPPLPDPNIYVNEEEYDYVQIEPKDLMLRWNRIWRRYQSKGICNQKLLLECPSEPPESKDAQDALKPKKCRCRTSGVGLPTVVLQRPVNTTIPLRDNVFTNQYRTDRIENIYGESVKHHGQFLHKKKCVVAADANIPNMHRDMHITNPCDFFLPMIGLCSAECQQNASCKSVNSVEKQAMRSRSLKIDFYTRIRSHKVHEVYHQKCVCKKGHICRELTDVRFSEATTFRNLPRKADNEVLSYMLLQFILIAVIFPSI